MVDQKQGKPATWNELVERFAVHLSEQEKSPNTIRAYQSDLLLFQSWYAETYQEVPALELLSAAELRAWKVHLSEAKLAPQSINRRLAALQSVLRFGQSQDWCQSVAGPRTVRQEPPRPRWLTANQQKSLIRAVERSACTRDAVLVLTMLHLGLRVAEAESLRWNMLELSPRKGLLTVVGKGRKQRTIPLNADARAALLKLPRPKRVDWPVFEGRQGGITSNRIWRIIKKAGRAAKLDDLTPHTLRHSFCRRLAEKGVRLEEIASLAGHESIETTRKYVEPGQDDLRRAVEMLAGGEDD
jgi:integrase/recombinase XerC